MEPHSPEFLNRDAHIQWLTAAVAGLITGAILWLLSHGTPWFTSGFDTPAMMGRDFRVFGDGNAAASTVSFLAQLAISACYGLIIGALVTHFRQMWAVAVGGLVGLALYGLNYLFFHLFEGTGWSGAEPPVIVCHLAFGLITAGLYKGLASRRRAPA